MIAAPPPNIPYMVYGVTEYEDHKGPIPVQVFVCAKDQDEAETSTQDFTPRKGNVEGLSWKVVGSMRMTGWKCDRHNNPYEIKHRFTYKHRPL